jgi:hypothetical protein
MVQEPSLEVPSDIQSQGQETLTQDAAAVDSAAVEAGGTTASSPLPYLDEEDLGAKKGWEWRDLPSANRRVRVRYLTGPEITQLQFLPELRGFEQLRGKLLLQALEAEVRKEAGEKPVERSDLDISRENAEAEAESTLYLAHVAHMSVMGPKGADPEWSLCDDCGLKHRPAHLSKNGAARLKPIDLRAISTVALRADILGAVGPFSVVPTPQSSPSSADSTEPTPPKS